MSNLPEGYTKEDVDKIMHAVEELRAAYWVFLQGKFGKEAGNIELDTDVSVNATGQFVGELLYLLGKGDPAVIGELHGVLDSVVSMKIGLTLAGNVDVSEKKLHS